MQEIKQPIVIKKVSGGHKGHHGGSWKVAFADFATAMMAFFMLLWLIGQTTAEQRGGISEYFQNPSMVSGTSSQAPTGAMGPGGAGTSMIDIGQPVDYIKPGERQRSILVKGDKYIKKGEGDSGKKSAQGNAEIAAQLEKQALDTLMLKLKEAVENHEALKPFKDQLLIDITPEGLRIQIVDKENRPMFDSGSSHLKWYMVEILREISAFLQEAPNKISITGHTDATPFTSRADYSNWELSADRANSARRALLVSGVPPEKIGRVVGLASTVLFDRDNPTNPVNRRISIIVMNKKTEMALLASDYQPGAISTATADFIEAPDNADSPAAAEPEQTVETADFSQRSGAGFIEKPTAQPSTGEETMPPPTNDEPAATQTRPAQTKAAVRKKGTAIENPAIPQDRLPEFRIDRIDLPPAFAPMASP